MPARAVPGEAWTQAMHARAWRLLAPWAAHGRCATAACELLMFGLKQAWACLFGGLLLGLLLATHVFYPEAAPVARYDFLVIAAVLMQAALLGLGLESRDEAKVILAFHLIGTAMEVFKTHVGSWAYPEASVLRIGGVPLFSGFMYAAVGSYIARVWRVLDFRFTRHPPLRSTAILACAIYVNFFSHHFLVDVRWLLFAAAAVLFGRTVVWYTPADTPRPMPLLLGFFLVALFIWLAENLGTFAQAWTYPHQRDGFRLVGPGKLWAWMLLMMISYVLVSAIHRPVAHTRAARDA